MTRGYLQDAAEGCLVYDAEGADREVFSALVISGPMCDPALPPEGVSRFGADLREAATRMAPGLAGAFGTLATLAQSPSYSGLDTVGVDVYRDLLRTVPGIKIGRVVSGQIEWEG